MSLTELFIFPEPYSNDIVISDITLCNNVSHRGEKLELGREEITMRLRLKVARPSWLDPNLEHIPVKFLGKDYMLIVDVCEQTSSSVSRFSSSKLVECELIGTLVRNIKGEV